MPGQHDVLARSDRAPAPRTLIDILRETAALHPRANAIDDATGALSYRELVRGATWTARRLREAGVRRGDRVGVRMPSGTRELYLAILGILTAGAAYVPVDADDPEERAALVFAEAGVRGVISGRGQYRPQGAADADAPAHSVIGGEQLPIETTPALEAPTAQDDAWVIFTSGSTGTPKGVAVSHRSAAAFVDAESRLYLRQEPIGEGDRVLAGLSVAFDASCEEMWLAWRYGACLVPAPRALVRTGADLGPWLSEQGITIVSTVPTLAALWPLDALERVRLLIFGGESCPPELVARVAGEGREVWNTYGPTEATVVACATPVVPGEPVRIGLPLDGWDLAVVGLDGNPVAAGEVGELIIGGVGLARYLDAEKDGEKYAPHPQLGWARAYRSGDLVRFEPAGLLFQGRVDDQVKVGGRRIELGEIEAALQQLPGVSAAAVAVQKTAAGNAVLVGYVAAAGSQFDRAEAVARLRDELPAALVPLLAVLPELPVRTSGKVDKAALPWPLPAAGAPADSSEPEADAGWQATLAGFWRDVLGVGTADPAADFFDLGGGSLSAAQLVARIRERAPWFAVADVYTHPRLGQMADYLSSRDEPGQRARETESRTVTRTPRPTQWAQTLIGIPLFVLSGLRWLLYLFTASAILHAFGALETLPSVPWPVLVVGLIVFVTPWGRMAISVAFARCLLAGVRPGDYPRGGGVHLRVWLAEQVAHQIGAVGLAGAPWITYYARALGATIGRDVNLHALPPVTGMLTIGRGASIEPEVDLAGHWIDGDVFHLGRIVVGAHSTVGARSTLLPGTRIGKHAQVAPGSSVNGPVPSGQRWAGSPAARVGRARQWWPAHRAARRTRWLFAYAASAVAVSLLPVLAFAVGGLIVALFASREATLWGVALAGLDALVPATLAVGVVLAGGIVVAVRLLALGLKPGVYPVRSRAGWQAWTTERMLDLARTVLFPLYASLFTPVWLRLLGATVGRQTEVSTVLLLPSMTTIGNGAFLADDTMVAGYELGGGRVRIARTKVGARTFLGNSSVTAGGIRMRKDSLVAVLAVAPDGAKPGQSWLGSPPVPLRRTAQSVDDARTFNPTGSVRIARAVWELCRIIPVLVTCAIGLATVLALAALVQWWGVGWTIVVSGIVMLVAGAVAAAASTLAKWILLGRIRGGQHPLWSSFVWRSEVSDVFTEMVAAPWFALAATGTPALVWWLRSLGSRIGHGVWCESHWLPEADLVSLGDASSVGRGCVVQTHLFHDRIMSLDSVTLEAGASLGPHSVILPAARLGRSATVGPASLVMRGEYVPESCRFSGNPIVPWEPTAEAAR